MRTSPGQDLRWALVIIATQINNPSGPTGAAVRTRAGRDRRTLLSTCGKDTRTMSPASKRVIGRVEIVGPFGEARQRSVERVAGAAHHHAVAVDLIGDLVPRADTQG